MPATEPEFEIEKGVPMVSPKMFSNALARAAARMEVGDSIVVPWVRGDNRPTMPKNKGQRFVSRTLPDKGAVRFWRTA